MLAMPAATSSPSQACVPPVRRTPEGMPQGPQRTLCVAGRYPRRDSHVALHPLTRNCWWVYRVRAPREHAITRRYPRGAPSTPYRRQCRQSDRSDGAPAAARAPLYSVWPRATPSARMMRCGRGCCTAGVASSVDTSASRCMSQMHALCVQHASPPHSKEALAPLALSWGQRLRPRSQRSAR